MPFFTYILYSESNDRFYIGSCKDVLIRLKRHNDGATPSTKPYRPWKVVWIKQYEYKSDALKKELFIKKMKSRKVIEELIKKYSSAG